MLIILRPSLFSFKVLGESLCLTKNYHNSEEKIVVVNSKLESVEVEIFRLRKDLIEAMNKANKAREKAKELNAVLRVEKMLIIQKDEEIQAALLKTDAEREKVIQKFMKSEHFLTSNSSNTSKASSFCVGGR